MIQIDNVHELTSQLFQTDSQDKHHEQPRIIFCFGTSTISSSGFCSIWEKSWKDQYKEQQKAPQTLAHEHQSQAGLCLGDHDSFSGRPMFFQLHRNRWAHEGE
jgi:hypothetical protein